MPDPTPTPASVPAHDRPRPPSGGRRCPGGADDPVALLVESIDAALADAPPGEAILLTLTTAADADPASRDTGPTPPHPGGNGPDPEPSDATSEEAARVGERWGRAGSPAATVSDRGAGCQEATDATTHGADLHPSPGPDAAAPRDADPCPSPGDGPGAHLPLAPAHPGDGCCTGDCAPEGCGAGDDAGDGRGTGDAGRVTADAGPDAATCLRRAGDVGWLPLGGQHPLDALLGFVAPPEWHALGLTCSGQALAQPGDPADVDHPVRVTTLLTRAGRAVTVLRAPGRARRLTEAPGGALGDAMHRVLGLPTAPPPSSSAALWVTWWLDRIVEAALTAPPSVHWPVPGPLPGSPAGWAAVAGRHPACPFAPPGRGPRPATLAAAARDLARRWPWSRLRTDPRMRVTFVVGGADGDVATLPDLPPQAIADWMDDGMYARWLLSSFPALDDLLDACDHVLPDALADRVRTTVALTLPATPPHTPPPSPARTPSAAPPGAAAPAPCPTPEPTPARP
jgi:hypothetical protein